MAATAPRPHYRSLFLFRRDLRLEDNTALLAALESSQAVIPAFVFDPRQIGPSNRFRSEFGLRFMLESLRDLDSQLQRHTSRLYCFGGLPHKVVQRLITEVKIDSVFVNRDYTPFSRKRDEQIASLCRHHGVSFHCFEDSLLVEPERSIKSNGEPYTVFTPFYRALSAALIQPPRRNRSSNYYRGRVASAPDGIEGVIDLKSNSIAAISGGRQAALKRLRQLHKISSRSYLLHDGALLSAHLKFGTVSIREVHDAIASSLGLEHELIRRLYWRDFFTHVAFNFPHVFEGPFRRNLRSLRWANNRSAFKRWCEGCTGFPIVDAGMRQLNQTGFMPNRVRMIVASFLVKDLHIDWRWGEQYFAGKLVDYDPAVNNGNWQWVASTGCDAAPYFRIFNPWTQQKRFDPACDYIKTWVPELKSTSADEIHNLYRIRPKDLSSYPVPMVNHNIESKIARQVYANARAEAEGVRS